MALLVLAGGPLVLLNFALIQISTILALFSLRQLHFQLEMSGWFSQRELIDID